MSTCLHGDPRSWSGLDFDLQAQQLRRPLAISVASISHGEAELPPAPPGQGDGAPASAEKGPDADRSRQIPFVLVQSGSIRICGESGEQESVVQTSALSLETDGGRQTIVDIAARFSVPGALQPQPGASRPTTLVDSAEPIRAVEAAADLASLVSPG